jgi:hypothetical protein
MKVALENALLPVLRFPTVSIIPPISKKGIFSLFFLQEKNDEKFKSG